MQKMQQEINNKLSEKAVVISVLELQSGVMPADWRCECSGDTVLHGVTLLEACKAAAIVQADNENFSVDIVLPAEMAALQNVNLPAKNSRQAMQALPFVVEEQLAVDVEKVHLAVGLRQQDGAWPVIVIDVAVMSALIACCEQANLRLRAVYVDAQLLPAAGNSLSVAMYKNRILLRTEKEMAVFDDKNAAEMIHFFLGESALSVVKIYFSAEVEGQNLLAQQLATEFAALGETRVEMVSDVHTLSDLLLSLPDATAINLLQGRFFVRQPTGKAPLWKIVVAAAVIFWVGQCLLQVVSGWYFNRSANRLEIKMDTQFRKLFPDMRRVGSVKKQIETQLLVGAGNNDDASFAKLFSASIQVLNAMPDHQGFEISELRYDDQQGQVELEVKAKSIDQLDQYKQALSKAGLSAKISSANDGGNGVEGRMQISRVQ